MTKEFYDYSENFGQLFLNLLTIEFLLRTCIVKKDQSEEKEEMRETGDTDLEIEKLKELWEKDIRRIFNSQEGDMVVRNALTDENSFSNVIEKFNAYSDIEYKIDRNKLVKLRNGLAHGRISFYDMKSPPIFFNYKRVEDNEKKVRVLYSEKLDEEFFQKNLKYTLEILESLHKIINLF